MIYWYENLCDDPEFDLHDYIIETGLKSFNGNIYENFLYLSKQLNNTLEFNLQVEELEDFNIYDHSSLETVLEKIESTQSNDGMKDFYQRLIHHGEMFNISGTNNYYCSSYSINRISITSGIHISNLIQNQSTLPKSNESILGYFIYTNYIGYFSSKVFNPFRKCDLYLDIMKKIKHQGETSWHTVCLKILRGEISSKAAFSQLSLIDVYRIGKQIGNIFHGRAFLLFFR